MKRGGRILLYLTAAFWAFSCKGPPDRTYGAIRIDPESVAAFPQEHHIEGLTWIANEKAYCVPTCLQMIGEWAGVHEPIEYYNWLTGYSYGGFYKDSFVAFMPISDTMAGIRFGAEYLGLRRILHSTTDPDLCIRAMKSSLSRGEPVMIMYDYNTHTEETFFFPHAAVLTGYSQDGFCYYEPGFHEEFTPDAGPGKSASLEAFMRGISTLQEKFTGSRGYSYMTFEKIEKNADYRAVWKRNGENMIGGRIPFIDLSTGSRACESLAKEIRTKEIPDWGWTELLPVWLSFGEYSRRDNAEFIGSRFSAEGDYEEVIALLRESSAKYGEINDLLGDKRYRKEDYRSRVPGLLLEIAEAEKKIGRLIDR